MGRMTLGTVLRHSMLAVVVASGLMIGVSAAPVAETSGTATITYSTGAFSSTPSEQSRKEAIDQARKNAWERYTAGFDAGKMRSYRTIAPDILKSLDSYIVDYRIVDERIDKTARQLTLVVSIAVNQAAFDAKLAEVSKAGAQLTGDGSTIAFLFVARQVASSKSFDEKRTNIEVKEGARDESRTGKGNINNAAATSDYKTINKVTSGGSVERKADEVAYLMRSSSDVETSMKEVLGVAGFETTSYEDVVTTCGGPEANKIRAEFAKADEISRESRASAIKGARDCEARYFALGTMDVGLPDTDPVTGNMRVAVKVRGQVWNIEKKLPREVATVAPTQFVGLGPSADVASTNALNKAAKEAAQIIVNQLNAKGLE